MYRIEITETLVKVCREAVEISIALAAPSHRISPPWIEKQAAHLIASCRETV